MPTVAKPKQMCKFLKDECNWLKENKCKNDHKIDEEGAKEVSLDFTATTKFNLFTMKLQTQPFKTFYEDF